MSVLKSHLKIIQMVKIQLILSQLLFFPEKISKLHAHYVLEGGKDAS